MSITVAILIILALVVFSILFFVKDSPSVIKHKITLKELQKMHCNHPPILVTTIKNGRMEETLCYFAPEERDNEPQIMEIIPDSDFLLKYRWHGKKISQ